jgi:transposase
MVKPEPVIRFETDLGRQMQADFGTIRGGSDRLSVFIATLGWSRATYDTVLTRRCSIVCFIIRLL